MIQAYLRSVFRDWLVMEIALPKVAIIFLVSSPAAPLAIPDSSGTMNRHRTRNGGLAISQSPPHPCLSNLMRRCIVHLYLVLDEAPIWLMEGRYLQPDHPVEEQ
jgi:hypothetical protein